MVDLTDSHYRKLLESVWMVEGFTTVEEREEWRAAIRARARADKVRIRTGVPEGNGLCAYAMLYFGMTPSEKRAARQRLRNKYGSVVW
jgi:hypothetical protein